MILLNSHIVINDLVAGIAYFAGNGGGFTPKLPQWWGREFKQRGNPGIAAVEDGGPSRHVYLPLFTATDSCVDELTLPG